MASSKNQDRFNVNIHGARSSSRLLNIIANLLSVLKNEHNINISRVIEIHQKTYIDVFSHDCCGKS